MTRFNQRQAGCAGCLSCGNVSSDIHTFVAERSGQTVGSYILKPNQPGLGAHIANAGFIVSPAARGLGIGKRMGERCLAEARRLGFHAMQFNIVVSTNDAAVRHSRHGFVNAHIMFRTLDYIATTKPRSLRELKIHAARGCTSFSIRENFFCLAKRRSYSLWRLSQNCASMPK